MERIKVLERFSTSIISDAVEKVVGFKTTMESSIKPMFPCKIVGYAATCLNSKTKLPAPPDKLMSLIDSLDETHVLVQVFEDTETNISGWGGLLTLASSTNKIRGTILNCCTRDLDDIMNLKYPVFSKGTTPYSGAGKYSIKSVQTDVNCGGVSVSPMDIIFADQDGVVVIPKDHIDDVILEAKNILEAEEKMVRLINESGSISKAFKMIQQI
ncbi:hypothetical protein JMN32_18930 [Fulvivirga sp. 29W222]|uniref:Putative 4-hydroxy-4-methyl-2-oxoglutarate aldolase n=1 Tax=Fulvivirga marina TaxID=2494733 RepID=A0A937KCR0_9BACT|nr:hypothetical protein [Fulvivirga marina]MBL6448396.1 hypothetical protein [Fulvivirga marina]